MSELNNMNNNYVELYNDVYQPESFNFNNPNPPIQMPINLQAQQPPAQDVRVNMMSMNTVGYNNTENRTALYQVNEPTSSEYMVIREEQTQSVLGSVSANASFGEVLALTQM
ncbi:7903_t:CDS:2 [Paraglomus brasilianum]|uniref:7903_t:CDS:1 n=1 Tax=Paraglomus brasilianum TaxID=144538 RepID=A0A9N9CVM9_9GLOM|nr:7903_t:CDS:2 [Paraglomus brasilianum]